MKKLDHPNVVKLVEVLDDPEDDQLYMGQYLSIYLYIYLSIIVEVLYFPTDLSIHLHV